MIRVASQENEAGKKKRKIKSDSEVEKKKKEKKVKMPQNASRLIFFVAMIVIHTMFVTPDFVVQVLSQTQDILFTALSPL